MCNMKTLLKIVLGIAVLAGIAYVALPQYQTSIATLTPFLLALACPLSMIAMAIAMRGSNNNGTAAGSGNQQSSCGHTHVPGKPAVERERHA